MRGSSVSIPPHSVHAVGPSRARLSGVELAAHQPLDAADGLLVRFVEPLDEGISDRAR